MLRYTSNTIVLGFTLLAFLVTTGYGMPVAADEAGSEDQVKAAYIYNLLKFTTWPETAAASNTINVCLSGAPNPVARILANELRGRAIQNKALTVLYIPDFSDKPDEETANLLQCHLLYLSEMTAQREQYLTTYSQLHSIITVSDRKGYAHSNGMIELATNPVEHKISLVINMSALQKANIILSSKLLQLAELIKD